jgi:hypothetical protein
MALAAAAALVVREAPTREAEEAAAVLVVREVRVDAAAPATPVQRVAWFQAAQEAA